MAKDITKKILSNGKVSKPKRDAEILLSRPEVFNFVIYMIESAEPDWRIALELNLPLRTFERWKTKHIELWREIENQTKENIVRKTKASFLKRAYGFTHKIAVKENGQVKEVKETYYPPDTKAAWKILTNFDPENFKDVIEQQHTLTPIPSAFNFVLDDKTVVEVAKGDFKNTVEETVVDESASATGTDKTSQTPI